MQFAGENEKKRKGKNQNPNLPEMQPCMLLGRSRGAGCSQGPGRAPLPCAPRNKKAAPRKVPSSPKGKARSTVARPSFGPIVSLKKVSPVAITDLSNWYLALCASVTSPREPPTRLCPPWGAMRALRTCPANFPGTGFIFWSHSLATVWEEFWGN